MQRTGASATLGLTREASRNLGAFRSAYAWLLADLIAFSRRRVVAVVGLNLLGVVLQWSVVGSVLVFVSRLTGGGTGQVPLIGDLIFRLEASFAVVSIWGVAVLLLVIGAALAAYGAETIGFETAQRYVARRGRDVLEAILALRSGTSDDSDSPSRQLQLMLARDQILRALLVVQRSLRTVLMVVVASVVLVFINPVLAAVVAAVATLFVVPYYLVNRRVVGAATALEERSKGASASVTRIVEQVTSREPSGEVLRVVPDLYPSDLAIAARWTALRDIMLGGQRTTALMSGMFGMCLVAVVVAFSVLIARGGASWPAALTFIIGLNIASGAFIQLAAQVTTANRFLPYVQRYIAFVSKFDGGADRTGKSPSNHHPGVLPSVRAPKPLLPVSDPELTLTPGTRALCIWPGAIDRLNLQSLLGRLVAGSQAEARRLRDAAFFFGDSATLPPVRARELLASRGMDALEKLEVADEFHRLPDGDATVLTPDVQEQLSPLLRYALGVVEGLESELLVLGWKSLARLGVEDRRRLLRVLQTRPLLFPFAGIPGSQPTEITHTIVVIEQGVAGMGQAEWYRSIRSRLPLEASASRARGRLAADGDLAQLVDDT